MSEQIGSRAKIVRGRGMARASLELIEYMHEAAEAAQPITGRGIAYKLFAAGLIPSMATPEVRRVYRLLKEARERGMIPWEWIVDETRSLEQRPSWEDPDAFIRTVRRAYRRDYWAQQPHRVQVWSEKGTVRGVLAPVLNEYGVGFQVVHGFSSATVAYNTAQDKDGRLLFLLYVGDTTRPACTCPSATCPSASPSMAAPMSGSSASRCFASSWPTCRRSRRRTRARTHGTRGSSKIMATSALSLTRWIPATCATSSKAQSREQLSRQLGSAASSSKKPKRNRCAPCSMHGGARHEAPHHRHAREKNRPLDRQRR